MTLFHVSYFTLFIYQILTQFHASILINSNMKPLLSLDIPSDTSSAAEYEGGPAPFGAPGFMGGGLAGPAYGANPLSNTMSIELYSCFYIRGTNAIKLLKEDLHVGVNGLLDPATGQVWGNINPA